MVLLAQNLTMQKDFKSFFLKFWWWNILIDLVLFGLVSFFMIQFLSFNDKMADVEVINLVVLIFASIHAVFMLVHFIQRAIKKYWLTAFLTLLHTLILGYICFLLGFTFMLNSF